MHADIFIYLFIYLMKRCFVIKYSITHFSTQTGRIVIFISTSHKGMFRRS